MNVYGPCTPEGKREFTTWLKNVDFQQEEEWIITGDFRNRDVADPNDMFLFNSTTSHLGLTDIPLQGKKFTWSKMQSPPLLEKLDWVFTNNNWTLAFLETTCTSLVVEVSDHTPLLVSISTDVPKAHLFRFKNFWLLREGFHDILADNWNNPTLVAGKAKALTKKFKNLKGALKAWSLRFSNLRTTINNTSMVIQFLDLIEEFRDLSLEEWNFRVIIREKLLSLLEQQRIY